MDWKNEAYTSLKNKINYRGGQSVTQVCANSSLATMTQNSMRQVVKRSTSWPSTMRVSGPSTPTADHLRLEADVHCGFIIKWNKMQMKAKGRKKF